VSLLAVTVLAARASGSCSAVWSPAGSPARRVLRQRADRARRAPRAPRFLPETERRSGRFDLAGALSSTLGMTELVYGIVHRPLR
jgi:hypothetical protein